MYLQHLKEILLYARLYKSDLGEEIDEAIRELQEIEMLNEGKPPFNYSSRWSGIVFPLTEQDVSNIIVCYVYDNYGESYRMNGNQRPTLEELIDGLQTQWELRCFTDNMLQCGGLALMDLFDYNESQGQNDEYGHYFGKEIMS